MSNRMAVCIWIVCGYAIGALVGRWIGTDIGYAVAAGIGVVAGSTSPLAPYIYGREATLRRSTSQVRDTEG